VEGGHRFLIGKVPGTEVGWYLADVDLMLIKKYSRSVAYEPGINRKIIVGPGMDRRPV